MSVNIAIDGLAGAGKHDNRGGGGEYAGGFLFA